MRVVGITTIGEEFEELVAGKAPEICLSADLRCGMKISGCLKGTIRGVTVIGTIGRDLIFPDK
jgi:hypothetical protein